MCTCHPFTPSKVLQPRGETEVLFYGILSAALHFDLYVPIHALLVAFILTAPLVVNRCHGYWLWALFYLKVGAIRLVSFVRITIL
jgi:hypothetical protein